MSDSYPCPCCGHRVLGTMPGSHEICPVDFGACDQHGRRYVRPPAEDRAPWPDGRSVLCWWLPTFWRHNHPAS